MSSILLFAFRMCVVVTSTPQQIKRLNDMNERSVRFVWRFFACLQPADGPLELEVSGNASLRAKKAKHVL